MADGPTGPLSGGLLSLFADAYGRVGSSTPEAIGDGRVSDPVAIAALGAGRGILQGLMAPGDAYQGLLPMYGQDGRTSPEAVSRAFDLASLFTLGAGAVPAEANSLRAGIRTYQNVPDSLMGYRKTGPQRGFADTNYPHTQSVEVTMPMYGGRKETFLDDIKGMNADHAYERAWRNWPDAIHISPIFPK